MKKIYRVYEPATNRFYGFALEQYLNDFLAKHPDALRAGCVEVTPQQFAEWKTTGSWSEDYHNKRIVKSGALLRWNLDDAEQPDSWEAAHMSVKDICKAVGLTQAGLAQRFCIPKRTVEDWCRGVRTCAPYIRLMMCELLGLIEGQ